MTENLPTAAVRTLIAIERGEVTLIPEQEADDIFAGDVTYTASNGWQVVVFNDCCSFDYVDSMTSPEGRELTCEEFEFFFQYDPPADVVREVYGIGRR